MIRLKRGLCVLLCAVAVFGLLQILPLKAEAATMTSSVEMVEVLKQMEGFNKRAFWDYGQYTVGYGTRCPDDMLTYYLNNDITEEEALELLREELSDFEEQVNNFIVKRNLTVDQGQFDALVSISYNVGGAWMSKPNTNLFRAVTSGGKGEDLIYAFTLYSKAGGSYLEGLIKRRLSEANMYINGDYRASNTTGGIPSTYKWVFLDGNGATIDGGIFGFDSNYRTKVSATFTEIPTGIDANGKPFAYKLAGWYTSAGKKVDVLDSTLTNGQTLTARWVDPEGNVLGESTETPVEVPITVTGNDVSIRTGPGTGYDRVGYAKQGDTFTVTAVASGSGYTWGKIGTDRWICLNYTDYQAPENPDGGDTTPESGFPKTGTVNGDDVRVRTGPGTGNSVVYRLNKGDRVTITEENRSGTLPWGKLTDGNWICLDYVTYDDSGIVSVELIQLPDKTSYETINDMLRLEGSMLFVTYADGTSQALSLTSEMITDYSITGAKEATVTAKYQGFTVTFKVAITGAKLAITKQPADAYGEAGQTVTVTVAASGEGLYYHWFKKRVDEESFVETDVTTADYTVEMTEELDGCQLFCLIVDENGESLETDIVTLHLGAPVEAIIITKQPADTYVSSGSRGTATVEAVGEGLQYQWYYKDTGDSAYSKSSITDATYACAVTAARDGREVYCVITDANGNTVTSEKATLNIKKTLTITKQPVDVSAQAGATASVSVQATGNSVQYVWHVKQPGESAFAASTVKDATYTLNMSEVNNGTQVYCVLSDCHGNTLTSNTVTFSLEEETPAPSITVTKQPQNVVVAIGERAATSVEAEGEGLTYKWYYKDKGDSDWSVSTLTGTTYGVTLTAARDGRQVYCRITDKYGNTVDTDTVTLSSEAVATPITITKQPENVVVAIGERAATSVEAEGEGLTYKWYYKDKGDSDWSESSLTDTTYGVTLTAARDGRQIYCRITDKNGNTVDTDTVTLSSGEITAPITITKQPQNVVVDEGERAATTVEAAGEGLTYKWYYKDKGDSNWSESTLTDSTYACIVNAARTGRQIYCVITDKYGNSIQTDTAEFTTVEAIRQESPDMQDAAEQLRAQMVKRETQITVEYLADEAVTKENSPASVLLFTALEHTGNPKEGDYLHRHCKGLTYSIDSTVHPGGHWVTATYTITYRSTAQQETAVDQKVAQIVQELGVSNASDYQKVKAIYDYLCKNVSFDYVGATMGNADVYTTYSALVNGKAVCHGFATAFYRLALELDVDTRLIAGKYENTSHGWNIVKIGGKYYNVDATRDAGKTPAEYAFFLKCDASMPNHVRGDDFTTDQFWADYPMASADYVLSAQLPGDMDGNDEKNTDDAVYLLLNIMFGDSDYAVADTVNKDTNGDGQIDTDDAVYLLLNIMFGEADYPLVV